MAKFGFIRVRVNRGQPTGSIVTFDRSARRELVNQQINSIPIRPQEEVWSYEFKTGCRESSTAHSK